MFGTSVGSRRKARTVAVVAAAAIAGSLVPAVSAQADSGEDDRLTLLITSSPVFENGVRAGDVVDFAYTVSNDTGQAIAPAPGSWLEIVSKWDFDAGNAPVDLECDFQTSGFGDFGDYAVLHWGFPLPAEVVPGEVATCTLRQTVSAADVAYGGLWTMMAFHSDPDDFESWDYSYWSTAAAVGVSAEITVVGTPAVGQPLTIDEGLWGPWDHPFTYQWLADDVDIPGATGPGYVPTAADVGKRVSVRLSAESTGVTRTSLPTAVVSPFRDVPSESVFYQPITWLVDQGITTGYDDGGFRPGAGVSRQAMAAFLYRFAGSPAFAAPEVSPFNDVSVDSAFYQPITWLVDQGITTGYDDGGFRPGAGVSRQAMAAFLYRFAGSPAFAAPEVSPFNDVSVDSAFYPAITWLVGQGITTGYDDGAFRPGAGVSRQAMAAFLYRFDQAPD